MKMHEKKAEEKLEDQEKKFPAIIFIDNAQNMCPTSWLLLEAIMTDCEAIVITLLIKSDSRDRMVIHPNAIQVFSEVWKSISSNVKITTHDLPRLNEENIGVLIV